MQWKLELKIEKVSVEKFVEITKRLNPNNITGNRHSRQMSSQRHALKN